MSQRFDSSVASVTFNVSQFVPVIRLTPHKAYAKMTAQ